MPAAAKRKMGTATVHVLPLRIQNLWLAIDTTHVEQILGERDWFKVPSAPSDWPGVMAWQGRAVAVLDLALRLGLAPLASGAVRRRTLIVKACDCLLAIPVDEIHEAQLVGEAAMRSPHATRDAYAKSELLIKDTVMPLFDPIGLVNDALASGRADPADAAGGEPPAS